MGNSFEELTDLKLAEYAQHDQYLLVLGPTVLEDWKLIWKEAIK